MCMRLQLQCAGSDGKQEALCLRPHWGGGLVSSRHCRLTAAAAASAPQHSLLIPGLGTQSGTGTADRTGKEEQDTPSCTHQRDRMLQPA